MTDKIFFDTNLIVYLFDKGERKKREKIINVLNELSGKSKLFISSQVINEFINVVFKKIEHRLSGKDLIERVKFLEDIFTITPVSYNTSVNAIKIKEKYSYSFWDSLIIASALESDCNLLFTEDLQSGQKIENQLEIINPLKQA
ncbi:MAG: hypothetical protein A2068_08130 [Ignavibacteria bacterium GWB2_35_6b]|nr:MAG: hypothetical protein A2068_08130 [Ignavibacteria bacterium GWB2_35_6b]